MVTGDFLTAYGVASLFHAFIIYSTRAVPEVPILNMFRYGQKAEINTIVSTVSILLNVANIKILQRMIEIG